MARTKKLLVPFDPKNPDWTPREFIIPQMMNGQTCLVGVNNGKAFGYGQVVYIGQPISEHDLFARLVDSGAVIDDVDETLNRFRQYVECVSRLRIGNVVKLGAPECGGSTWRLELVWAMPFQAKGSTSG